MKYLLTFESFTISQGERIEHEYEIINQRLREAEREELEKEADRRRRAY